MTVDDNARAESDPPHFARSQRAADRDVNTQASIDSAGKYIANADNLENQEKPQQPAQVEKIDIEHTFVQDDPREWSRARKNTILAIVSSASLIATLGANILNPSIQQIEEQLHASSADISWVISLFIFFQGNVPFLWSAVSEIKGRKIVYIVSIALFTVACIVVATAKNIGVIIGMRCVQGAGGSAVLSIGAATLADIYEPSERGTMMGLYYTAPLLGPALGPILGGALTQGFDWRATYWFLVIFAGLSLLSFVFFFKDTFRRERSLAYQGVLRQRMRELQQEASKRSSIIVDKTREASASPVQEGASGKQEGDIETGTVTKMDPRMASTRSEDTIAPDVTSEIKLSFKDVNPFKPVTFILRRWNNIAILFSSGLIFAFGYSICYTCSRTLAASYNFDALKIGLVLLSYGIGCMFGSVLGGRWSDRVLARLKAQNGGKSYPEMRLESTKLAMFFLPPSIIAYAWVCERRVNVASICVMLFLSGFFSIWIYAATLAYIVDANTGRSSTAVACNSSFRGVSGFIAAEVAVPLQDAIGDGWMYTLWAGLLVISELTILLVIWKGGKWREKALAREARNARE